MAQNLKGPITSSINIQLDIEVALAPDGSIDILLYEKESDVLLAVSNVTLPELIDDFMEAHTSELLGTPFINSADKITIKQTLHTLKGSVTGSCSKAMDVIDTLWAEND